MSTGGWPIASSIKLNMGHCVGESPRGSSKNKVRSVSADHVHKFIVTIGSPYAFLCWPVM